MITELNKILGTFSTKGASSIYLPEFAPLFKGNLSSSKFLDLRMILY